MEKKEIFRKSNLEKVSSPEQLNDYIKVINPSAVLMIGALILLLIGALVWGFGGTIPVTANAAGAFCQAEDKEYCDKMVCVLTASQAGKLKVGMDVQVSPDTASRDTYGYINGRIEEISQYPVSKEELTELVHNAQLAESIMPQGLGTKVMISFDTDSESSNHLSWSNSKGNQVKISEGLTGNALMILKNQKPIDLILNSGEE